MASFYDERKKGVSDLNRSAQFYEQVLGCTLGLDTKFLLDRCEPSLHVGIVATGGL